MCGIVGIYNLNNALVNEKELKNFANSLKHRGPDAKGTYINDNQNLGLGHRRLNILDLSDLANQPMLYNYSRYVIVFNGEIYNFLELKIELEELGYKFKTTSDTEVILASYMEWGERCQSKFNGMWAFAIWDNKNKSLFLSRDRFGVKPLYYLNNGDKFFFASELKAFMFLHQKNIPEFNYSNFIYESGNFSNSAYDLTEDTFLKNVKELNPSYQLKIDARKNIELKKWWSTIDNLIEIPKNYDDQIEKFKILFFDACKLRMRSDVKVATSLSGGMDSSSIVATINYFKKNREDLTNTHFPYNSFILDYKNEKDSEVSYAKSVIDNTDVSAKFVNLELNKIDPEEIIKSIYHHEAVLGDDGLGPWFIYKNIKENGIKVSIDGHGGDELLAGYSGYSRIAMKECHFPLDCLTWLDLLSIHLKMNDTSSQESNNLKLISKKMLQLIKSKIIRSKKRDKNSYDFFTLKSKKPSILLHEDISSLTLLNKSLYIDYHYKSMQIVLKKFDRLSMAHGVESRSPFLDWRLVTYLFSLPTQTKIGNGFTKRILRDAMKGILVNNVRSRIKKKGFIPADELFNKTMVNFINETIHSKEFYESEIWDGKKIKKFLEKEKTIQYKKIFRYIQIFYLIKTFKMQTK